MWRLLFLVSALLLTGCVSRSARGVCPVVVPWSKADQLALEHDVNASDSALIRRALREDEGFRDWARRCREAR